MLGIIGGTGLTQLANLEITHRQVIRTPYGEPSGPLTFGNIQGHSIAFLARHGYGHTIPPHLVNYRANLWAMHAQGICDIVSIAAVGGITNGLGPGVIAIPDQIIDYTHSRKTTYFEGDEQPVRHIDFTEPYSSLLREKCLRAAEAAGIEVVNGGVYAAVQGPRLETAAEINKLERDGATMVGMTAMPEAPLARELEMQYAAICVVANHAAGRGDSVNGIHFDVIKETLEETMGKVRHIIEKVLASHGC